MMSRTRWFLLLVVVLAVAALAVFRLSGGRPVQTLEVRRAPIVQTVIATGRVNTVVRIEVGSMIAGTVRGLEAREGSRVKAGQLLVRLDDREALAARNQARAALAEAEARITQLDRLAAPVSDEAVRQAAAQFELARAEHERVARLHKEGFFSRARLDEAKRTLDVAASALAAARTQASGNRAGGAEVELARARREQARAALAAAEARLDHTRIRAPAAGVLLARGVEAGDTVQPGRRLFVLAVDGDTQLVANVDEKNLGLLALGQKGMAAADAYPGRPFPAELIYIAPGIDAQRGTVEVKLRVPEPPEFLKADMTLSVEIEAARKADALVAPSAALRDVGGAAPWALVLRDGRAVRVPVRLGLRGAGVTEVLEGLAPGDALIPQESPLRAGERARRASGG